MMPKAYSVLQGTIAGIAIVRRSHGEGQFKKKLSIGPHSPVFCGPQPWEFKVSFAAIPAFGNSPDVKPPSMIVQRSH